MAQLEAFCDESGTEKHDLVIAGYLGPAEEWLKLETPWRDALRAAGLTEFKMRDCQAGMGEFKGRTDRIEIRDRFLGLIDSVQVEGFAVRLDVEKYRAARHLLEAGLRRQYRRPYFRAFEAIVQVMAEYVSSHPPDEQIGFWFDQQDEFSGRALAAFRVLKQDEPGFAHPHRLGGIGFADSKRKVPLQTADVLAYLIHRAFRSGVAVDEALRSGVSSEGGIRPPRSPIHVRIMNLDSLKKRGHL